MILSGETVKRMSIVNPCRQRTVLHGMSYGISPAGYDVRVREEVDLEPGGFMLASVLEKLDMPRNVIAFVHDKSTLARLGLALQNTVVEPGWTGYLTIEISNHGPDRVRVPAGAPIAQLIFHYVNRAVLPYSGKYQDQPPEAVKAKFDRKADLVAAEVDPW